MQICKKAPNLFWGLVVCFFFNFSKHKIKKFKIVQDNLKFLKCPQSFKNIFLFCQQEIDMKIAQNSKRLENIFIAINLLFLYTSIILTVSK